MQKRKPKKSSSKPSKGTGSTSKGLKPQTLSAPTVTATTSSTGSITGNQPRNLLLTDAANVPLTYEFDIPNRCQHISITVRQQDSEETWPGGAIWDLGILLASVCVAWASGASSASCTLTVAGGKAKQYPIHVPDRLTRLQKDDAWFGRFWTGSTNHFRWVELGCGVGLTGLVAAAALQPRAMLLTDLPVVVDQVTQPNVQANSNIYKGTTQCRALPLCWGNEQDQQIVADILHGLYKPSSSAAATKISRRKTKASPQSSVLYTSTIDSRQPTCADVVLIGDVAYQHKPGAPSHFDILHKTLLELMHDETLVIFGTRIRMPASVDLLELFQQDLEEVITPPISADELDPASFGNVKHNMTIHFMRKRKTKPEETMNGQLGVD